MKPNTWSHPVRTHTPTLAIEEAIRRLQIARRPRGPKGSTSYARGSREAWQKAQDLLWQLWNEVREGEGAKHEENC